METIEQEGGNEELSKSKKKKDENVNFKWTIYCFYSLILFLIFF